MRQFDFFHELFAGQSDELTLRLTDISLYAGRDSVVKYSDQMKWLAEKILELISESLGLPGTYLKEALGEVSQNVSVNYYPVCPQPDLTLGLQAHSDLGAITILMQADIPGLQVKKDDSWIAVEPVEDALVVNLGDMMEVDQQQQQPLRFLLLDASAFVRFAFYNFVVLFLSNNVFVHSTDMEINRRQIARWSRQVLTNGRYKSVEHRAVVNSERDRLSIATFLDPAKDRTLSPAKALVDDKHPLLYRDVLFSEFISAWYSKGPDGKRNIDNLILPL